MKISTGKHVVLEFQLFLDDVSGELVEETRENEPFIFIFKQDSMIPAFEKALEGLSAGESFSVSIKCEDAFGKAQEDLVTDIPKETFMTEEGIDEELIAEGEVIPMNDEEGNELVGLIVENKQDSIVVDFNHPLAGENIHFEGQVIEVSDPKSN